LQPLRFLVASGAIVEGLQNPELARRHRFFTG
jgi:hypothetical protein